MFLADSGLRQVFRFGRDGAYQGSAASDLRRPAAVAWDAIRQHLYVADSQAHAVLVFDRQGQAIRSIGRRGEADGEFNSPTHVALDDQGGLHVTDALNLRVQAFDAEGAPAQKEQAPKMKTPLQRYSLDQLKVVAIIAGDNMRKALLEDDMGKGYVVSVGDAVGSEGGQITAILQDRIVIEGTYRDLLGNEKVRRITKKLYISEEGENP